MLLYYCGHLPDICEEPAGMDVNHISRVLGIPKKQLHHKAGPINLLIGINYPRFHVGETKSTGWPRGLKESLGVGHFRIKFRQRSARSQTRFSRSSSRAN